jgi:FkbM family methyltransferase
MADTTLRGSALRLRVPLADDAGRRAVAFGENDTDLFRFLCLSVEHALEQRDDAVYVDVGANLGVFLLRICERYPIRCVGFEPQTALCALLAVNARANGLEPRLDIRSVALGAVAGEVFLELHPVDSGSSRIGAGGLPVTLSTLEREFTVDEWRRVAVMKIDVEGFESEVFRGTGALFASHRPTLVFEINAVEMRQRGIEPAVIGNLLRAAGYDQFWALDRSLYPIRNGVYQVANIVAVGAAGLAPLRRFGIDERFRPTPKKFWPVLHYDF